MPRLSPVAVGAVLSSRGETRATRLETLAACAVRFHVTDQQVQHLQPQRHAPHYQQRAQDLHEWRFKPIMNGLAKQA